MKRKNPYEKDKETVWNLEPWIQNLLQTIIIPEFNRNIYPSQIEYKILKNKSIKICKNIIGNNIQNEKHKLKNCFLLGINVDQYVRGSNL